MQNHFTYDELTPLEQCISDYMARQKLLTNKSEKKTERKSPTKQ